MLFPFICSRRAPDLCVEYFGVFILNNPVDITNLPTSESHYRVLRTLADHDGIDLLVIQFSVNNSGWPYADSNLSNWPESLTEAVIRVKNETDKPVAMIVHAVLSEWDAQKSLKLQQRCYEAGLPVFRSIASAATAIDRLVRYYERRREAR